MVVVFVNKALLGSAGDDGNLAVGLPHKDRRERKS